MGNKITTNSGLNDPIIKLGAGISDLRAALLKPLFIMSATDCYDPRAQREYIENNKTESGQSLEFDPALAKAQHTTLQEAVLDLGGSIVLSPARPGEYDGVFKADPGLSFMALEEQAGGKLRVQFDTVASRFYHRARASEVEHHLQDIQFLAKMLNADDKTEVLTRTYRSTWHGEGQGDHVFDPFRNLIFAGYKPKAPGTFAPKDGRTDLEFHADAAKFLCMRGNFVSLEVDNGLFHVDTSTAPLPRGEVIHYAGGVTKAAFETLKARVGADNLIQISKEDAEAYAANLTPMDQTNLIMPKISPELTATLEAKHYKTTQIDLDQFVHLAGGGSHCLLNQVNQQRGIDLNP